MEEDSYAEGFFGGLDLCEDAGPQSRVDVVNAHGARCDSLWLSGNPCMNLLPPKKI